MSILSWLEQGVQNGFLNGGEAWAFFKSHNAYEAAIKPVIVKRRARRTKAQIAADAAKAADHIPAQPAKRLGRKPGSKNRAKVVVSPVNGTQASA